MRIYPLSVHSPGSAQNSGGAGVNSRDGQGPAAGDSCVCVCVSVCVCVCVCVSARACSGMCVAGSGCARAVMKMRSGKVVPLCSINQGGKENGCERQSLETAPREAERGKWEGEKFCGEWARSGPRRSPSPHFPPRRVPSLELRRRDSGEIAPLIPVSPPLPRLPALFPRYPPTTLI